MSVYQVILIGVVMYAIAAVYAFASINVYCWRSLRRESDIHLLDVSLRTFLRMERTVLRYAILWPTMGSFLITWKEQS